VQDLQLQTERAGSRLQAFRLGLRVLRATHEGALAPCSLADLKRFAIDLA
jgi:hypothetical protein